MGLPDGVAQVAPAATSGAYSFRASTGSYFQTEGWLPVPSLCNLVA